MRCFCYPLLSLALWLAATAGAAAAPINGGIGFAGTFAAVDANGMEVPFSAAVGIDFAPQGGGSGNLIVLSSSGDLAGISFGTSGTILDVRFAPFAGPVVDFFIVDGLRFTLDTLTASTQTDLTLALNGTGVLTFAGFDPTPGTFGFSGQTDAAHPTGNFNFTFSANVSSGGVVTVPEPESLMLLATALVGLGLARRARPS